MLKFSKATLVLLAIFGLIGCQSMPKTQLEPAVAAEQEQARQGLAEPEPVIDQDLQYYNEALTALKAGRLQLAIEILEELAEQASQLPYLFTNLGLAYLKQNKYDQAGVAFNQAIALNVNDAIAYNHLGIIKRARGDFNSALATYRKAIEINAEYAAAYLNLGILYDIYLQNLDQALLQYKQYQALTNSENEAVGNWIVDIERRLKSKKTKQQG